MNERFRRYVILSAATHVGVIVVCIVVSLVMHVRKKHKPHEIMTFMDVPAAMSEVVTPEPVEQIQIPEPPPPPPPADIPEPPKKKKKKKVIKKSEKRIKREPPKPAKPRLTPEEIRRMMASGVKPSSTPRRTMNSEFADYLATVRVIMYAAWAQPSELAGRGLLTVVSLRVRRDGTVAEHEVIRASGNDVMDQSVLRAVQSVRRLKPLPATYEGSTWDITVEFELTGSDF